MSDLLRALAFAYRRKGADAMSGSELRHLFAFDLRWFAPEDAKRVVARATEPGLLVDEGGALRPSFDVAAVEIPLNFRPGLELLDAPAPTALPVAAPAPAAPPAPARAPASELERAAEDERRRRGLLLSLDVARLVVRRRAGEDVAAEAAAAEARLLSAAARARP